MHYRQVDTGSATAWWSTGSCWNDEGVRTITLGVPMRRHHGIHQALIHYQCQPPRKRAPRYDHEVLG